MSDEAWQEAARRWPSYPSVGGSVQDDRQSAFVAGAEWQQQKQDDAIRESGALAMAESAGADVPQPLVALLTTVDVLSKRWAAMTVRVSELQAMEVQVRRIRALVAGELGAAGSVQAVRAIREILGEGA